MDVRVKVVAFPISLMVISLKLIVLYNSAQAVMISSFLAAVSSSDPFGILHLLLFILTQCQRMYYILILTLCQYVFGILLFMEGTQYYG